MLLASKDFIRFEGYVIDRLAWTLTWDREPIALKRKSFDVLVYLIDRRDRVIGKDELLQALWPDQFVEDSNLSQHIFLLRKALSRHATGHKIIETIPGRGYRFTASVEIEQTSPPQAHVHQQIVVNATESITEITYEEEIQPDRLPVAEVLPARRRRLLPVAAGVLAVAALATVGWFGWQHWLDRTGGPPVEVLLTPLQGSTGDPILDGALFDGLRMDLAQSPFVSLVSPARLRQTLKQMEQKPDEAITPTIAQELCERTNSQAVLRGSVARVGTHFLLTEEATSCVNGAVLADAHREASAPEDLPGSIDRLAETLRRALGESRRSIAKFDMPLLVGNTSSLEALKDFSQAAKFAAQGKNVDAIEFDKKAIAADPNFADAYYDLAAYSSSIDDPKTSREAIIKAYSLRDLATEPVKRAITAFYHATATMDLYEAERNYRDWSMLYPRANQPWNGLYAVEKELGHHAESLVAAQRALDLRPDIQGLYMNLAGEQSENGDFKAARATCELAISRGLDGDLIRERLFQAVYALHDTDLLRQQREWAAAHPDAIWVRVEDVEIAIAEGRFSDVHRMMPGIEDLMRHQDMAAQADDFRRSEGSDLIETGDIANGVQLVRGTPVDPTNDVSVEGLARIGDFAASEKALKTMQTEFPQATLWNYFRAPEVHALIAMAKRKPKDAIAALEVARSVEDVDPVIARLRGDAHLANGEPALAEKDYREVVSRPWQLPDNQEFPLSWLGLGRAFAAEGNRPAAIDAYQHFLTLWAHADPDAKFLVEAKNELQALRKSRSVQ